MNEMRAELSIWGEQIETLLASQGVLDGEGNIVTAIGTGFPNDVENALDGFIENPIELIALLNVSRDARDGRPISLAVLQAAHLMAREVVQALKRARDERA